MDERHGAGRAADRRLRLPGDRGVRVADRALELRPRQESRRAHLRGGVLGVVEGEHPGEARVAQVVVVDVAVLVPGLASASGRVEVAVPVRIEDVSRTEEAGQGAGHRGMPEDVPDLRYARQDVVSRVPLLFQHRVEPPAYALVEGRGVVGVNGQVPVGDELLHLSVGEEAGFAGRGMATGLLLFGAVRFRHDGLLAVFRELRLQLPGRSMADTGGGSERASRGRPAGVRPGNRGESFPGLSSRSRGGQQLRNVQDGVLERLRQPGRTACAD